MRSTFKILFYINRQKTKADGKTAIFCRVTIDGRSAVMQPGKNVCRPNGTADRGQPAKRKSTNAS